jgi:hypothetical protein
MPKDQSGSMRVAHFLDIIEKTRSQNRKRRAPLLETVSQMAEALIGVILQML